MQPDRCRAIWVKLRIPHTRTSISTKSILCSTQMFLTYSPFDFSINAFESVLGKNNICNHVVLQLIVRVDHDRTSKSIVRAFDYDGKTIQLAIKVTISKWIFLIVVSKEHAEILQHYDAG